MFRSARPRFAPPRMDSRAALRRGVVRRGLMRRSALLALAATAAAVCGCHSRYYGPSPYGGNVPGYYGQPGGYAPQQPYGQPQFAPQPIPGTLPPGGTNLGAPSNGVPALPAPDPGFSFPDEGDFDDVGGPSYNGGFGETPTGGGTGGSGSGGSGSPFYGNDNAGYGQPPTGGGSPVPPIDDYDTLGVDSPNPGGVDLFEPPPPGTTPDGFQDPLPEDFGTSLGGSRPGLASAAPARLPQGNAQPMMAAPTASAAPLHDPAVQPAGAVQPAPVQPAAAQPAPAPSAAQPAGPPRTVTGVVSHDAATGVWTLTYSLTPEPSDRFGGALTLIDDGRLAGLESEQNLIVSVNGHLDPAAGPDALGKPRFRVASATEKGYYEGP
ncbi:hypothetical protein [Alienimonas californiensis]|uniref:Uncharacterized protein n=1 Tax=Alienimonas californiensis TaxID=2527989 RepID=A0A517P7H7_9PLAN|nr:hypothetical protein [Alienimonas californiensis]QDT15313.1 hypothetical protein CA12_13960 [Alienimonas californiensis]